MSRPTVSWPELAQRVTETLARRDVEAFLALVDPEVEFRPLLAAVDGGVYRGHDAVRTWLEDVYEAWEGYQPVLVSTDELDDRVAVAEILIRLRGHRSTIAIETKAFGVAVRGPDLDRIRSWSFHQSEEDARAAAEEELRALQEAG